MTTRKPTDESTNPQKRPTSHDDPPPSPPERHPGKKPEHAGGRFEDLEVRDRGNAR